MNGLHGYSDLGIGQPDPLFPNFLPSKTIKKVPSGVANYRNLPFGERATRGSWVRLPRKENVWSRHQCLFEENVKKKPERCGLQTLSVKDSGVVFTHGEDISTPRVRHKGRQPLTKCAI